MGQQHSPVLDYLEFNSENGKWKNIIINIYIRIKMNFIAWYVYTYEEFVFATEATAVQQNDSDRTKTQIIKRIIKKIK